MFLLKKQTCLSTTHEIQDRNKAQILKLLCLYTFASGKPYGVLMHSDNLSKSIY